MRKRSQSKAQVSVITTTTSSLSSSLLSDKEDIIINTKMENATEGLSSNCFNYLSKKVLLGSRGKENVITTCNYVSSLKSEINLSDHYRKDTIILLSNLSIFFKNIKLSRK